MIGYPFATDENFVSISNKFDSKVNYLDYPETLQNDKDVSETGKIE